MLGTESPALQVEEDLSSVAVRGKSSKRRKAVQVFPPEHHGHEQALHPHCITKAGVVLHQNQRRTGQFSDF